ncbi:MAG: RimK family alpha-L-glutamate ligase [Sedimenticola sp.]|nr:MAG: RimK family alpha-L-glutamate ligase [Sedimenticola sp.]
MTDHILLLEDPSEWPQEKLGKDFPISPVAARDYLTDPVWASRKGLRAINLCRDRDYLDVGYYCSLLAEARGHKVLPSVRTINDLAGSESYPVDLDSLNRRMKRLLNRRRSKLASTRLELILVFGQAPVDELAAISRALYEAFPAPLLHVVLEYDSIWRISSVHIVSPADLSEEDLSRFIEGLKHHLNRRWYQPRSKREARYDLAILHNPDEELPPSNRKALQLFIKAAREQGVAAELITASDYGRIAEFDALFIRETTSVSDYTYRFARKAQREGLVVIDDPDSILRCTNKIYLAERLTQLRLPAPKTLTVQRDAVDRLIDELGFPMVLKIPDGSFSRGVIKVENRASLVREIQRLFRDTELVLAQEFAPTEFDWRVGILNDELLFVCQYGMAPGHWQIVNHAGKRPTAGRHSTLPLDQVPEEVVSLAKRAARLMGNGLYGVDIKQTTKGLIVIEVNDNPNLDAGVEDAVLGEGLYQRIIEEFVRRLEQRGR